MQNLISMIFGNPFKKVKIDSFVKLLSDSIISTKITVGFSPRILIFSFLKEGTKEAGFSFYCSNPPTTGCIFQESISGSWKRSNSFCIYFLENETTLTYLTGNIISISNDGFEILWGKGNNPTGTGTIYYLAIG